eukprot:762209-Prorocentrum_minimum.AAC.1
MLTVEASSGPRGSSHLSAAVSCPSPPSLPTPSAVPVNASAAPAINATCRSIDQSKFRTNTVRQSQIRDRSRRPIRLQGSP